MTPQADRIRQSFRETFHWSSNEPRYGLDLDLAPPWLDRNWNLGIFYWAPWHFSPKGPSFFFAEFGGMFFFSSCGDWEWLKHGDVVLFLQQLNCWCWWVTFPVRIVKGQLCRLFPQDLFLKETMVACRIAKQANPLWVIIERPSHFFLRTLW